VNRVFKIGEVEFEELYKGVIIDRHSELIEYGRDYFEEYCRRAVTEMGRRLTCFRKAYAEAMAIEGGRILDYGCGFGTIILTDRDNRWRGYDINDKTQMILGGNFVEDPNLSDYRMICLFDCFEHFQEPERWLKRLKSGTRLVVTIPVWQDWKNLDKIVDWRHWKPISVRKDLERLWI